MRKRSGYNGSSQKLILSGRKARAARGDRISRVACAHATGMSKMTYTLDHNLPVVIEALLVTKIIHRALNSVHMTRNGSSHAHNKVGQC